MRMFMTAVVLLLAAGAQAASTANPADLPSAALVVAAIEQDSSVAQARAALAATRHSAGMIKASPHEWTARAHTQTRRYDSGGQSREWGLQLERPIRIGGKAGIDAEMGETLVRQAESRLGEAIYGASRALLDSWLDWQAAASTRELLAEQLSFAESNEQAVNTRRRAGDASVLELNVAMGDLSEVQRQLSGAQAQQDKAAARLRVRFPGLNPAALRLTDPADTEFTLDQWLAKVLDVSESLQVAQHEVRRAELAAARARAERIGDPTLGIFAASEASRSERIVGVSISIPLGSAYRRERAAEALQQVEVARAALDAERRVVELRVAETYSDAVSGVRRWRQSESGAVAARDNARLTQRAYTLGELDLQALLLSRRQARDAIAAAATDRIEALRALYRLRLDAEMLWRESELPTGNHTP